LQPAAKTPETGQKDRSSIEDMLDILARLYGQDLEAGASGSFNLSKLLAKVVAALRLRGCFIVLQTGTSHETVAQHGVGDAEVDAVVEDMLEKASSGEEQEGDPMRGPRGGNGARRSSHPISNLVFDGIRYAKADFRLADDQRLSIVFKLEDPAAEAPEGSAVEPPARLLGLAAMQLCGAAARLKLMNKASAIQGDLDRVNRELKEMQVCSLNIMEDLQRKNRDLSMLNDIARKLASWKDLPGLTKNAANAASRILDGAEVTVFVRDLGEGRLKPFQASDNLRTRESDGPPAVASTDPLLEKLSAGECPQFDPAGEGTAGLLARETGCKTGLIVPLRSDKEVQGFVLACERRWHRVFTDEEVENLKVMASTLAIAMENADLLSRMASQVQEMSILKEYIETVVDSVDLGVMVIDDTLKITMFNRGFERLYGYKKEEFQGKQVFEVFPHLVEQGFSEVAQQVLKGTPFMRYGWQRTLLNGTPVVQNFRVFPHRDASGNIVGGIAIIEDVTEKAQLEDQLAKSESKFSRLVEDLDDGYLIVADGKIVYANRAASDLAGTQIHELIGMRLAEVLDDEKLVDMCTRPIEDRSRYESKINHSTGTWIPVEVGLSSCEYGGHTAVSVLLRDITETRRFEKQLEDKNREMRLRNEQITRLNLELEATIDKLKASQESLIKSERVAAITQTSIAANHEINNPLFAILGQAQLLLRKYDGQDEDTLDRLRTIEDSALRIACVTKKLANLADPVVKQYSGLAATMIDVDKSTASGDTPQVPLEAPPDASGSAEDREVELRQGDSEHQ
jgi:PAS domain S-box-containing protein